MRILVLAGIVKRARWAWDRCLRWLKERTRPKACSVVGGAAADLLRSKRELIAENALLRQQLIVLKRSVKRLKPRKREQVIMVALSRLNHAWRDALHIVQPGTLLKWHRQLFKWVWWRKSKPKTHTRKPKITSETVAQIKAMAEANRLWGAERIRRELLKLGTKVSKRTIQRLINLFRGSSPRGPKVEDVSEKPRPRHLGV